MFKHTNNVVMIQNMNKCSLCKKSFGEENNSTWVNQNGDELKISETVEPTISADTSIGELSICEPCYHSLPSYFTQRDLYEIHYQFGLVFNEREQYELGVQALKRAISINTTANSLAALGYAQHYLGLTTEAISTYKKALEIEPENEIAKSNLKNIGDDK